MRVTIASLAVAAYLGLASADSCTQQPTGYDPTPGILAISSPDTTHPVTAGTDATITWNKLASTASTVSIVLCKGPSTNCVPLLCIANSASNSAQSYSWHVPTDLSASGSSGGYGLKIIEDGTGRFQYSTQFGVLNSNPSSPSGSSAVQQISDGQIQAPTGSPATQSTPKYTVPASSPSGIFPPTGNATGTGTGYYVPAPTGKTSNTTHPANYYSYGVNTAPQGALTANSTYLLHSTGAVTVPASGGSLPAVTQTAIAGAGAGGVANGGVGSGGTGSQPAGTQSPIAQASPGAAGRVVAGGVLAGVGAVAALVL